METKDAIAFCHYYKGENECPFKDNDKSFLWNYERAWVYKMTNNEPLADYIGDYIGHGLTDFHDDDGVPLSLKAVLLNRYINALERVDIEAFKEFYSKYYK